MPKVIERPLKTIIDREMLIRLKTCPACGRKFNLGEPVVPDCSIAPLVVGQIAIGALTRVRGGEK